jgi:hypothetical protein
MNWKLLLLPLLCFLLALGSCRKDEEILRDSSAKLEFSTDTIIFDTVFTSIGSATKILKVYNNNNQRVSISSIYLADASASSYRVNVNGAPGEPGVQFTDVEIPAEDSIFVFIEVTIDPNEINSPLIEADSLVFETNGNVQDVDLVAWGQDANFYFPQETGQIEGLPPFTCLDADGNPGPCSDDIPGVNVTWTNEKPIVIYGYVIVDEDDCLTIEAGTQIYFHEGSGLWVWEGAQLKVLGSFENPVVFQGDRLEPEFDDVPGQWDLIRLYNGEAGMDHIIQHAEIKNSILGLEVQTIPFETTSGGPYDPAEISANKLILSNTIIRETSAIGLLARNFQIDATNCLFANAGQYTCAVRGGGNYDFWHCTFANYWSFGGRSTPSFFATNLFEYNQGAIWSSTGLNLTARSCIMSGTLRRKT